MNPIGPELISRCRAVSTSTWSDALDQLGLPGVLSGLALRSGSGAVCGVAVTVRESVGEANSAPLEAFAVGSFLDALYPGAFLMIDMGGVDVSTIGGLAATAAVHRGAAGVAVDGGCRDVDDVRTTGLWVASRHVTPVSGKRRVKVEAINGPVRMCDHEVNPGDIVIGDATGLVVIAPENLDRALELAEQMEARDRRFAEMLNAGDTFSAASSRLKHV